MMAEEALYNNFTDTAFPYEKLHGRVSVYFERRGGIHSSRPCSFSYGKAVSVKLLYKASSAIIHICQDNHNTLQSRQSPHIKQGKVKIAVGRWIVGHSRGGLMYKGSKKLPVDRQVSAVEGLCLAK